MRTIFTIAVYSLLAFNKVDAQDFAGAAIVVNIHGEAQCISLRNQKLSIGSILAPNDTVYLQNNSTLTLLGDDGQFNSYRQSFRLRSPAAESTLIHKLIRQSLQSNIWLESAKHNPRNNFRSIADVEITMVYPRNTRLRKPPEQLKWIFASKSKSEFEVSLRCYENDFSYDEMSKGHTLILSSDIAISAEKQYYWFVRDIHAELSEIPPAVWFYVLDRQELKKFEQERVTLISIMREDTLSAAYQLLYANLLVSYELYEDCRNVLDVLIKTEPHNPVIHTFYAIIFDKMDMMNDSQKYIEYSDQFGK